MLHRRQLLAAGSAAPLAAGCGVQAQDFRPAGPIPDIGTDDIAFGDRGAPVQVVQYASMSCPHCATWWQRQWPLFRWLYVTPGHVQFAVREFPTPPYELALASSMLVRCAAPRDRERAFDRLYAEQEALVRAQEPLAHYARVAAEFGLDVGRTEACLADEAVWNGMVDRAEQAMALGVSGTPQFAVDGVLANGEAGLHGTLSEKLFRLGRLPDRRGPPPPEVINPPAPRRSPAQSEAMAAGLRVS